MLSLVKIDYETNVYWFSVDEVSEIDMLPKTTTAGQGILSTVSSCRPGSMAIVTSTSEKYILNDKKDEWVRFTGSSGSGGGSSEDYGFADEGDIDNIFKK